MFTVADIRKVYNELDSMLGIDTSHVAIEVSNRMTRTLGYCRYQRVNGKCYTIKIVISKQVMIAGNESFQLVIRHEYAHMACNEITRTPHGHDAYWKKMCEKCGGMPTRTGEYKDIPYKKRSRKKVNKVTLLCENCGATFKMAPNSKAVRIVRNNLGYCTCPHCKGRKFKEVSYR